MILLLGSKDDAFTGCVSEWLSHFKQDYVVLLGEKAVRFLSYDSSMSQFIIEYHGVIINLFDIDSVLSRRKGFKLVNFNGVEDLPELPPVDIEKLQKFHVNQEFLKITEYIYYILKQKSTNIIGSFNENNVNKLIVSNIAKEVGFDTPQFSILSTKKDLFYFYNKAKDRGLNIITKPMAEGVYSFTKSHGYYSYVERVKEVDLKNIPDNYFPSLFQVEVKKKYELRVFYLNGICYSMVILSQKNICTETDFRKPIINGKINRKVPYKLPDSIESKIIDLMDRLELNTGSIDILVDLNDNYYFLEVNPVGQILMTSVPCNYYLDRLVAKSLFKRKCDKL